MENTNHSQNKLEKTDIYPTFAKQTSLPSYGEVIESKNQYASEASESFDGKLKRNHDEAQKKEGSELIVMEDFSGK